MYLLRLKKVKGSVEIKTNAFQYCYTDETFQKKKKSTSRLGSIAISFPEKLSGPDAMRIYSDISAGTFVDAIFRFSFFFPSLRCTALHMASKQRDQVVV